MGVVDAIGSIGPVAKFLLKALELIDPKTRDWVRKRKALEWAEKYILTNEEIKVLKGKVKYAPLDKKEIKKLARLEKKLRWYKKWFFDYD